MEYGKGFDNFGVLFWELPERTRLEVFLCIKYSTEGYSKIPDGVDPQIAIDGNTKIISDSNLRKYTDGNNYHCWVVNVPKNQEYELIAKTKYSPEKKIPYLPAYSEFLRVFITLKGTIDHVILHADGNTEPKWSDIITTTERYDVRFGPAETPWSTTKHDVYVKYNAKVNKSGTKKPFTRDNLNGYNDNKFGSVFLDGDRNVKATVLDYGPYKTYYKYQPVWLWKPQETRLETGTEWIEGKAACEIQIPIEDIVARTATNSVQFSYENSRIVSATAKVRCGVYVGDDFFSKLGARLINDDVNVYASFGGKPFQKGTTHIGNSYQYRENNVDWLSDFTYTFDETSEVPQYITVKVEWEADVIGIYVAVDYVDVDVTYYTE